MGGISRRYQTERSGKNVHFFSYLEVEKDAWVLASREGERWGGERHYLEVRGERGRHRQSRLRWSRGARKVKIIEEGER